MLHAAVIANSVPKLSFVLTRQPDLTIQDNRGNTALQYAELFEDAQTTQMLQHHVAGQQQQGPEILSLEQC